MIDGNYKALLFIQLKLSFSFYFFFWVVKNADLFYTARDVLTRSTVEDVSQDISSSNYRLSQTRRAFPRVLLGLQGKEGDANGLQKVT